MILTIGMIVKNEGDKLQKCLESLTHLRNAVSSELVIVDTGSTDNTVQIAKSFTDDVRTFEWCNDFSAARNKSMKNANGEWFMFIDADEWFENSDELINFFISGEYKKYNSASYIVRNHADVNINGGFVDFEAPRLVKIMPKTRFVNRIHEKLNTYCAPIKKLSSFVHHFGYIDVNAGDQDKKRKRNEELLLKCLEDEPKNPQLYVQLFNCYFTYDNELAVKYARKGIEVNKAVNQNRYYEYVFLKLIALAYKNSNKYEQVIDTINEYHNKKSVDRNVNRVLANDIDIADVEVYTHYDMGNTEQTVSACIKYNSAYKNYILGKYTASEVSVDPVRAGNDAEYVNVNIIYFEQLCKLNKMHDALLVLDRVSYQNIIKYTGNKYIAKIIELIIDMVKKLSDYHIISDLFEKFSFDANLQRTLEGIILSRIFVNAGADKDLLRGMVKSVNMDSMTVSFSQIIKLYYSLFCDDNYIANANYYANEFDVLPEYLADAVWIAVKCGNSFDIGLLLKRINHRHINEYISSMNFITPFTVDLIDFMAGYNRVNALTLRLISEFAEGLLNCGKLDDTLIVDLFRQYSLLNFDYINMICKQELLTDEKIVFLPKWHKKGYYCYMACKGFDNNDTKTCINYMRKAALIDISLKNVVSAMGNVARNTTANNIQLAQSMQTEKVTQPAAVIEQAAASEQDETAEFEMLSKRIKDNIKVLIARGDKASAQELFNSYKELNPADPEIVTLSFKINR